MSATITLLLGVALGLILLVAGVLKLMAPKAFQTSLTSHTWLPSLFVTPLSYAIPIAETVLGILLVAGVWYPITAMIALLLLTSFTIAIAIQLHRDGKVDCNCFGKLSHRTSGGGAVVIRNIVLIVLLISSLAI